MADTKIDVLDAGSVSREIDVRTESTNGQMRQVVVLGDPASNSGVAPVDGTNGLSVNITNASIAATVSGVATAANQTTIIGHVDGIEGLLTTIDADTGNIATSTGTVATAIYNEGDTDASITGIPFLWEDAGDELKTVSLTSRLPVDSGQSQPLTDTQLRASAVPVSAASLPLPTNAATEATLASIDASLNDISAYLTTSTLGGGATYSSGVLALTPAYSQVQTQILASHDGTMNIYWYTDAGGTDLVRTLSIPYVASSGYQIFSAPCFGPYVKYEYTNGGTPQTDFYYETKFLTKSVSPQIVRVDGAVLAGMTATVTRSVISGETTGGGGGYVNAKVSPSGTLQVGGTVAATQSGTWNLTNISGTVSLPTGASTESTLSTLNGKIPSNLTVTSTRLLVDGSGVTQPVSGTVSVTDSGYSSVEFVRNDYTGTNVTTGAYVQLIASTAAAYKEMEIFDSSGQTLKIAFGAAASEVDKVLVFPGGNGRIRLAVPSSTRVSVRAVSATASSGEICINLYG